MTPDIAALQKLYHGFYLETEAGNNAISWARRKERRLYVPELSCGSPGDLKTGDKIVFAEYEEGREKLFAGLDRHIYFHTAGKDIFIFDNHNHAFSFWAWAFAAGRINHGEILVHIDQHSDMRTPEIPPGNITNLEQAFHYTNHVLNVGSFIRPALELGWFCDVVIIDGEYSLNRKKVSTPVLDIDADFFAPEMDFVPWELKMRVIRDYIRDARLITIASSPFFIDQERALQVIREMLREPLT